MQQQHLQSLGRVTNYEAIQNLNVFPERIRIMESEPERALGLRQLSIDNFSVFYVIEDKRIVVTRVLYSASDINSRLLNNLDCRKVDYKK